jgi:hypothetical protein
MCGIAPSMREIARFRMGAAAARDGSSSQHFRWFFAKRAGGSIMAR